MLLRTLAFLLLVAGTAAAEVPRAHAVRRTGAIAIDGHLDEPDWARAPKQGGFTQRFPKDGARATFDTHFAVLYDDEAIYVGVWCDDPQPARIRRLLTRRDVDSTADAVAIGIDSYHDRRTAYVFQLNAAGVQRDQLVFDDAGSDDTWDAVWTGDAAVTDHGWTAELRIPLSQLRFSGADVQEWGFQVLRIVGRTQEQSTWSPWPRTGPEIVSKFGVLDGIAHVESGRRLELLPYVTGGLDLAPVAAGDPLNDHAGMTRGIGLDLKYGLGHAFTVSATINPDFGQVEADPSQVNLGPTELFFAEKRPFFLEGMDLFRLPIGTSDGTVEGAFYSRRIGAVPGAPDVDYRYLRQPDAATIYGAAKLTGKTASGWSIGALDAVTGEETTALIDSAGQREDPVVAPLTNFALARVKRDLRGGETSLGASVTAVDRALGATALATAERDQAYTGGLQLEHRWGDNAWQANVSAIGSWVHGTADAIAALQTDTVHLYQRPDATDVHVDPTRTSLSGAGATWKIGRLGATEHWRVGFGGDVRTPGLELNDLGFQTSADRGIEYLWGQYREDAPGDVFLNWQASSDALVVHDLEPRLLTYGLEWSVSGQFANYWSANLGGNVYENPWDPVALRGGPTLRSNPNAQVYASANTDTRRWLWLSVNTSGYRDLDSHATNVELDLGATVQARSNIDLYLGPTAAYRIDPMQYVAEADDTAGTPHYLLARIVQRTVSLTTRLDWTFSPNLSLQVYAQPFVSAGRYSDYKDVDRPHAARFQDRFHVLGASEYSIDAGGTVHATYGGAYSFARPDFDLRQLRSTVVLRWEYRPGSTVFAIWSHGQTSALDEGAFQLSRDVTGLVSAPSENLLMIKANYWIGV